MHTHSPSRPDDDNRIRSVVLCCDFLATRESEQASNLRWLEDLLARPIAAAIPSVEMRCAVSPGFRRKDVLAGATGPNALAERHTYFDAGKLSDTALAALRAEFGADALVVGYEMSKPTRIALDRAGVPWIDIWLHPVRFADDILFAFRSSVAGVQSRIDTFAVQEDALFAQADLLKIQNYRGFAKFDATLVDGAAVFAGQMARDKSILTEDGFLGLLDFQEQFTALARQYPHIYFAAHPNEPRLDRDVRTFLDGFSNVSITTAPIYHLMADKRIAGIAAISSSVLEEARYFGKAIHRLSPPPFPLDGPDRYTPVFQAFCFPHFWAEVLGAITETRQSDPAEFLDPKNKLRHALSFYWGYRHIDRTEALSVQPQNTQHEEKKLTLETADLVSFDVFDTLIARKVSTPDDVFALISKEASAIASLPADTFVMRRKEAELCARKLAERAGREDPTHAEIYAALLGSEQNDPRVARLCKLEFDAEKDTMVRRPAGAALYRRAQQSGRRIVLASDMYLPRAQVEELLKHCGYDGWDALYVSSELGLTKRNGTLFSRIMEETGISPSSILHVGDNPAGDKRVPEALGIECQPLPKSLDIMSDASPFLRTGLSRVLSVPPGEGRDVAARLAMTQYDDPASAVATSDAFGRDARAFGYVTLGPLLAGFAGWLHEHATAQGIERLGFLTREGPVFRAAYEALFPKSSLDVQTLFASRRIAAAASLQTPELVKERLVQAIGGRYSSAEEFLSVRFGLEQADVDRDAVTGSGLADPEGPIDATTSKEALRRLVSDHEHVIIARSGEARDRLADYLRDTGMSQPRTGLVDIGYVGRIQAAYAQVAETEISGFYLATYHTSRGVLNGLPAEGYLATETDPQNKRLGLCRHRKIYETLLCAPGPSFIGLRRAGAGWEGVPETGAATPYRDEFVTQAHEGALAFVRDYADSPSALSPLAATAILDAALDDPSDALVDWLGGLEFGDAFDGPGVRLLAGQDDHSVWRVRRSPAAVRRRPRGRGPRWEPTGPYGILGWRHALTPVVAHFVGRIGEPQDADHFRDDPIGFFRRLSDPRYRRIGQLLYPWD